MKTKVMFFVSYSTRNKKSVNNFMDLFKDISGADKYFEFALWDDSKIEIGENWHDQIQEAIKQCAFGLLLISPTFLSSKYIVESELVHFQGTHAKKSFPAIISDVDFVRHDLKGLKERQLFRYAGPKGGKYSFDQCNNKEIFVRQLYEKIHDQLKIVYGVGHE